MSFLWESPRLTAVQDRHLRQVKQPRLLLQAKSQSHFYSGNDWQKPDALHLLKSMKEQSKLLGPQKTMVVSRPQSGLTRIKTKLGSGKQNDPNSKQKSLSLVKGSIPTEGTESTFGTSPIHELQHRQILGLFEARCADSQIYFCKEQSAKFLQKIEKCCKDRRINLSNSWIGFQALSSLCGFITTAGLFHINLEKNQIGDSGAVEMSKVLRNSTTIVYLNIASNNIRETGAQHIFGALRYNASLVELDISSKQGLHKNCIRTGTRSLKEALKHNTTLAVLNIASTQLNLEGLSHLTAGLKQNSSVSSLDIGNNDLGPECVQDIMHILRQHQLLELNLANNNLGNDSIKRLMEFISKINRTLRVEKLDLSGNGITHKSSPCMFDMLRKNSTLQQLNLSNNQFHHDNRMVSLLLEDNSDLKLLNLDSCKIDAAFAYSLSDGLRKSRSLQTITLNRNLLDLECVSLIVRSLETNLSLQKLEMKNCHLEDSSAEVIGDVLLKNNTLKHLNLSDNYITDPGARRLMEGMGHNTSLREILLKSNFVSYKLLSLINQKLTQNRLVQVHEKLPRFRQKLETVQQATARQNQEVEDFGKYLLGKQTKLTTEIAVLELEMRSRQKRIQQNSQQYQTELKQAEGTLKQLAAKLSISHLINENIDRKIHEAQQKLHTEQLALASLQKL